MAYIDYIKYDDASDRLKALYEEFGGPQKRPANVVRVAGPNPAAMESSVALYQAIMQDDSPLSRSQREMIAMVVSAINKCHY